MSSTRRPDEMILEGVVTSLDPDGEANVAPMGPLVTDAMDRLILRPWRGSRTLENLRRHGEGVFHVTDDCDLVARAAIGRVTPPLARARVVDGWFVTDACRAYEFRIERLDEREERATIDARVVHVERMRDFFGFHRARHAVLEAAILATRITLLPADSIARQFADLRVIVDKTGSEREDRAMRILEEHIAAARARSPS